MPRLRLDDIDGAFDDDDFAPSGHRSRQARPRCRATAKANSHDHDPFGSGSTRFAKMRRRADGRESFKCRRCRAFIGPTVSGGRHRNHCPLCLYSRHVDAKTPGDRASSCRSLMAPIGVFLRPKGEQVVLHRCLGCGIERHNRIAADDNPAALLRLPPVAPRTSRPTPATAVEEEIA